MLNECGADAYLHACVSDMIKSSEQAGLSLNYLVRNLV